MDGWLLDEWMDECVGGWMRDGWLLKGWMDERMNGRTDGFYLWFDFASRYMMQSLSMQ